MNLNATLFGEMLTFAVLVWVMVKYIWPPLIKAIEERQQKIASGIEAAERGKLDIKIAHANIAKELKETKFQIANILNQANQRANAYIAKGKEEAEMERDKILAQGKSDLDQEIKKAKQALQERTADLVITITEKVLQQKIDNVNQKKMIDKLIANI